MKSIGTVLMVVQIIVSCMLVFTDDSMGEVFAAILSICFAGWFFVWRWHRFLSKIWPPDRNTLVKRVFWALPLAAGAIIFFTLNNLASFDVTDSFTFAVIVYVPMGYAIIFGGLILMSCLFDISYIDDSINNGNKAAVAAVAGGYIALAVIYSGAHVGDGPGWWCVVFACGFGYAAWFLLWMIFNIFTGIFERVTIGRDLCCGVRLGCYFIASGIVLARASAGDWTSFGATIVEFADGWPVLPLMAAMFFVERLAYKTETPLNGTRQLRSSVIYGAGFTVAAILLVIFAVRPLPENAAYSAVPQTPVSDTLPESPVNDTMPVLEGRDSL